MDASALAASSSPMAVPDRARRLAALGLIPFVLGALLVWFVRDDARPYVSRALAAYAGVTVAFLGAIHWGLAMRQPMPAPARFGWAVGATLIAAVALLMPPDAGLVIDGVMLVACYLVDRKAYPAEGVAHWLTLRFRLSATAALSCFIAAANA